IRIRALSFTTGPNADMRHEAWLKLDLGKKYEGAGMKNGPLFDFSLTHGFSITAAGDAVPEQQGQPGVYVFSARLPGNYTAAQLGAQDREPPRAGNIKKREYVFLDRPGVEPRRVPQRTFEAFLLINSTPSGRGLLPAGSWAVLKPTLDAGRRIPVFILGDL